MTTEQPQARPQRPRPVMRKIEVAGVERITPHMVRVSFTGEGLKDFALPGPAGPVRTPRRFADAAKRPDVDIVLHEGTDGPGSSWAKSAGQGNQLLMTGPSG